MSIRKRHGVWHCDVVIQHGGKQFRVRKSCDTTNRAEALAFEAREREKLIAQRGISKKAPFFSDFADEFIRTYAKANNKPSEVASKENSLKHLRSAFGHLRLDEIGAEQIERYKATKLAGDPGIEPLDDPKGRPLAPKSINNHLICLAKLFAVAVEWGKIAKAPKVKLLKVPETDFDFFDFAEADRLVDAAVDETLHWFAMILTALRTGMRIGELIALRWDDIDFNAGTVMVRRGSWNGHVGSPKGGKPKPIPMSHQLADVLRKLQSRFFGGLVFPDQANIKAQRPLTREQCHRPLHRSCKRAGLRRVGWHVLRHTFCSHLAIRGVPIKTIQELARHQSIHMTMRYAHLTPDVREDAINLLDGAQPAEKKAAKR